MANPPPTASSSSKPQSNSQSKTKKSTAPSLSHVNPSPIPEMSAAASVPSAALPNGGERQRGPVEEVIAKRMRQLGKKLQRYRTYAVQKIETLNADQKAALASLPALEGAYKELEDLIREKGPVDEQELIQAAKMREASEAAESTVQATAQRRVEAFQNTLVHPLSRFLRLQALLHPARSADHEHLTFGHLTLPSDVQATDVLRVGSMYEDLQAGGEAAKAVLSGLAKGPTGEGEETDHLHHLFHLLDQPDVEPEAEGQADIDPEQSSSYPTADPSEAGQPDTVPVPDVIPLVSPAQSNPGMPNGHSEEKSVVGGMSLNFLQHDELEPDIEESFEVVPMLEPHQTSGLQPPFEENAPAPIDTPATFVQPTQGQAPAAFSTPSHRDWAEMGDDDDEEPVFATSSISAAAAQALEVTVSTESGDPVLAVVQNNVPAAEAPITEPGIELPTAVDSNEPLPQIPVSAPKPVPATQPTSIPARPRAPSQQSQQARPKDRNTIYDEEGFEMKLRRGPSQINRGRGGRGGGGGGGGDRRDRGRGGPGRGRGGGDDAGTQAQGPRPPRRRGLPPQPAHSGEPAW